MAATRICLHLPFIIINRNEDGDFPIIPFKQVRKWEGERRTPVFSSCLWHDMCVAVYGPMQPRLTCAQAARAGSVAALTCLRMYGKINGKTFWNTQALLACSACLSLHCVQGKDKQFEKAVIGWFKKKKWKCTFSDNEQELDSETDRPYMMRKMTFLQRRCTRLYQNHFSKGS